MIGFTKACHRTQGFVTEPSQKRTAREEAGAAASDATATIFAENDGSGMDIHGFEAHLPAPNTFCWRQLFLRASNCSPKLAKWRPAADTSLYRDPYYNGIWEIQCIFWWFFESAGAHKRFQTLPAIPSGKKCICNIKIKIKIFSTWFSSDFELNLHPKKWWFLQ